MSILPVLSTVPVMEAEPPLKRGKEFLLDDSVTMQEGPGRALMVQSRKCPTGTATLRRRKDSTNM
jgi:hypothetical protein